LNSYKFSLFFSTLGLRPRHPHAYEPLPAPTEAPVLTAIVGQHHDITLYASTPQHGRPTQLLTNGKFAGFIPQPVGFALEQPSRCYVCPTLCVAGLPQLQEF
ncbi:MAG: hypothetical protein LBJ00_12225, partial [Planctomycetaceae bacterium]|nr:hypothetical protein [Planctomycetaceae bacterium]